LGRTTRYPTQALPRRCWAIHRLLAQECHKGAGHGGLLPQGLLVLLLLLRQRHPQWWQGQWELLQLKLRLVMAANKSRALPEYRQNTQLSR
jgi:hypothetical protein